MGSFCDYTENKVVGHILKVASYTPPATPYLALFTADPTDTGSLANEATYTGYGRKAISFGAAANRLISQNADVNFDPCTGGSNIITHYGIMDGISGGNMLAHGALSVSKTVQNGVTPVVESGQCQISYLTGAVATAYANLILDWLFRGQALAQPTNIFVGLFSTACGDAAPGTELTGNNYARVQCNTWNTPSGGASANTNAIEFPQASGDWVQAVYAALFDALTGGTYMIYLDINDLTVLSGERGRFLAGDLDVTQS